MAETASSPEIRAARGFLATRGISPAKVSPAKFAASAKELDVGFRELLRLLGHVLDGGRSAAQARRDTLDQETAKVRTLTQQRAERKDPRES